MDAEGEESRESSKDLFQAKNRVFQTQKTHGRYKRPLLHALTSLMHTTRTLEPSRWMALVASLNNIEGNSFYDHLPCLCHLPRTP